MEVVVYYRYIYSNKYLLLILTGSNCENISSYLESKYHNFRKVLMHTEIGLDNIALLSFGKFKMVDISRLLQNEEFVEIPPDESIVEGINVDRQQVKDFIDQQKKSTDKCTNVIYICVLH